MRKISPTGPTLALHPPRRRLRSATFTSALGTRTRVLIAVLSVCWAASVVDFWVWWLTPAYRTTTVGLVLNSVILVYISCYPVFFVTSVNRVRRVSRSINVPELRIAFVVTRAPAEPWEIAKSTLCAMKNQDFPFLYHVWLCDERPTAEILNWCTENEVAVATRQSAREYHRDTWPRRTKCKEGNLAYFYDHWGYRDYDVVAQLDCDHRPSPTYLREMVRPFADPAVGYVAAPSVCDANATDSWAARGRLYREAAFHGAFQLGHSDGWAPACIGSHYTVRTAALQEIGGLGPELAEDFSTSFLLNSAGWHGVFAIDAEAHGDGPNTFAAMLVQEFQWARSLTTILFGLVPRNLGRLPWSLRLRFIYALFFYSLLVASTAGGLALALTAAVTGRPWIDVNYFVFLLHWWVISFWLIFITIVLRRQRLLRPPDAPVLSWESWLYTLSRWPYIGWGICAAVLRMLNPRPVTFKVTPKGNGGLETLPARLLAPYLFISAGSAAAALFGEATNDAVGYVFLCIAASCTYCIVSIAVPILHGLEVGRRCGIRGRLGIYHTSLRPLIAGLISIAPACVALGIYPGYAIRVLGL